MFKYDLTRVKCYTWMYTIVYISVNTIRYKGTRLYLNAVGLTFIKGKGKGVLGIGYVGVLGCSKQLPSDIADTK